jgi:hypothetical protein
MIYCEIFSMTDQQKKFLWKYFEFIRLLIKIGNQWLIVNQFFVINNQSKKLNTATLISTVVIYLNLIILFSLNNIYVFYIFKYIYI